MSADESNPSSLTNDPLLRDVPEVDGQKFLDPALLDSRIGQGAMGAVYRGKHRTLKIDVAVKCLKPHLIGEHPHIVERFGREARLTAQLSHQNLVRLYEFRQAHGLAYLVLEYVDGETARERVRRKGPLSEVAAARVVLAAARGLAVAHRHHECIVHRDIKPDNVLISRRGAVKLADLGLAKAMERLDASTFATDGTVGTPRYMAPEQWNAEADLTPQADVWALGATLYFLLTGEDGLRGTTMSAICGEAQSGVFPDPREIRPELSVDIARLVLRCTRLDPAARPADAMELARELQGLLARREAEGSLASRVLAPWKARPVRVATGLVLLASISLGLFVRGTDGDPVRAASGTVGPPMSASPGVLDPETHRMVPPGWEVLDGSPGYGNWAPRVREPRSGIEFLLVPPGRFQRGSPPDEAGRGEFETQHWVTITRPFYMAEHEVTNEQLRRIDPTETADGPGDHPALGNWHGARAFSREISCDLPTEAQWELAARAGTSDAYIWGAVPSSLAGKANVLDLAASEAYSTSKSELFEFDDGHPKVAPVKSYAANALGFHDLIGNVREWCLDGYRERYEELPELDPFEYPEGPMRVLRGGSWLSGPDEARAAARHARPAKEAFEEDGDYGFRPVRQL